jgi:outer membrane protein OmpA-like peptidoglycan-associated protein
VTSTSEADRIAKALAPRQRRGGGLEIADPKSIAVVEKFQSARTRRGRNLQEHDELFEATKDMPQLDLEIYFAFGTADVTAASMPTLTGLGQALSRDTFKASTFVIGGHTDRKGSAAYNQGLSELRAETVARHLIEIHKIDAARVKTAGYGFRKLKLPAKPLADENRRVQIVNAVR